MSVDGTYRGCGGTLVHKVWAWWRRRCWCWQPWGTTHWLVDLLGSWLHCPQQVLCHQDTLLKWVGVVPGGKTVKQKISRSKIQVSECTVVVVWNNNNYSSLPRRLQRGLGRSFWSRWARLHCQDKQLDTRCPAESQMDPVAVSPSRVAQMETEPRSHTHKPPGKWGWAEARETRLCL